MILNKRLARSSQTEDPAIMPLKSKQCMLFKNNSKYFICRYLENLWEIRLRERVDWRRRGIARIKCRL